MSDHSPEQMRAFAVDFFSAFGAQIEPRPGGELTVHLTPELAAHFGKPSLYLTFRALELSPFEDLVVFGSRVFDRMIAWLEGNGLHAGHGVYAALSLPARAAGPADPTAFPPGVRAHHVDAVCRAHARPLRCVVVNLRITCVADDRRDELLTLVLDEQGESHPELAEAYRDAVPQADPPSWSGPALARLAERAAGLARSYARQRSAEIEAEQRERAERTLEQLRRFYQVQIAELDNGQDDEDEVKGEERAALKAFLNEEMTRKVAEEVERHRVRVEITPINWATLTVPAWDYELTLSRGELIHTLNIAHNLYLDRLNLPLCHACGQPTAEIGLCEHGHVAGGDCLHTCAVCGRELCTACGMSADPIGGEWVCADCAVRCDACGQAFIPAHTAPCAFCGRPHCLRDLRECPVCGRSYCTAHVARCTVCGALRCLNDARRCAAGKHAVCEQHHTLCPVCGEGMCPEHTVICALCQQPVCSDCVGPSRICRTCGKALGSPPVTWPDLPPDMRGWTWHVAQNARWWVYYGQKGRGVLIRRQVIVVTLDGQVLYRRQWGWVQSQLERLQRRKR